MAMGRDGEVINSPRYLISYFEQELTDYAQTLAREYAEKFAKEMAEKVQIKAVEITSRISLRINERFRATVESGLDGEKVLRIEIGVKGDLR